MFLAVYFHHPVQAAVGFDHELPESCPLRQCPHSDELNAFGKDRFHAGRPEGGGWNLQNVDEPRHHIGVDHEIGEAAESPSRIVSAGEKLIRLFVKILDLQFQESSFLQVVLDDLFLDLASKTGNEIIFHGKRLSAAKPAPDVPAKKSSCDQVGLGIQYESTISRMINAAVLEHPHLDRVAGGFENEDGLEQTVTLVERIRHPRSFTSDLWR